MPSRFRHESSKIAYIQHADIAYFSPPHSPLPLLRITGGGVGWGEGVGKEKSSGSRFGGATGRHGGRWRTLDSLQWREELTAPDPAKRQDGSTSDQRGHCLAGEWRRKVVALPLFTPQATQL